MRIDILDVHATFHVSERNPSCHPKANICDQRIHTSTPSSPIQSGHLYMHRRQKSRLTSRA